MAGRTIKAKNDRQKWIIERFGELEMPVDHNDPIAVETMEAAIKEGLYSEKTSRQDAWGTLRGYHNQAIKMGIKYPGNSLNPIDKIDEMRSGLTWFVYELIDPKDGKVKYVGCSKNPRTRYSYHLRQSTKYSTSKKEVWIYELSKEKLNPTINIIAGFSRKIPAFRFERDMIRSYEYAGFELFNTVKFTTTTESTILND